MFQYSNNLNVKGRVIYVVFCWVLVQCEFFPNYLLIIRKEISQLQKKEVEMKKAAARGSKAEQKAKKKQVEKTSSIIKKNVSKDEDERNLITKNKLTITIEKSVKVKLKNPTFNKKSKFGMN